MTLTPEQLEERKALTLQVLKVFMDYCRKHNLRYYAAYGTALGVVRHSGFIPWDDDIDLYMPRPDYDKLMELYSTTSVEGYDLLTPEQTPDYHLTFAKFSLHNSTLFEAPYTRCNIGIFVDIFPLDGAGNGKELTIEKVLATLKKSNIYNSLSARMRLQDFYSLLKKGDFRQFISLALLQINRQQRRQQVLLEKKELLKEFPYETSDYVINFQSAFSVQEQFPKQWLEEWEEMPFEDTTLRVFKEVRTYLTNLYDDYMTPPPIDKRIVRHTYYRYNPHQRENFL